MKFRRVLAEKMLGEVPEGGFRCRYLVRFRRVLVQMLCEIPKGQRVPSFFFNGISTYILWHKCYFFVA